MSLDDIIFKFPQVKTRMEKWETLVKTVPFSSLGSTESQTWVIPVLTFNHNFSELA